MSDDAFTLHPADARLLDGRRALVTGGDSGIGQGVCFELAAHGAHVAINYVGAPDEAERMAGEIEAGGGAKAIAVQMDVASEPDVQRAFAATPRRPSAASTCSSTTPASSTRTSCSRCPSRRGRR